VGPPFVALVVLSEDFVHLSLDLPHVPRELHLLVTLLEALRDLLAVLGRRRQWASGCGERGTRAVPGSPTPQRPLGARAGAHQATAVVLVILDEGLLQDAEDLRWVRQLLPEKDGPRCRPAPTPPCSRHHPGSPRDAAEVAPLDRNAPPLFWTFNRSIGLRMMRITKLDSLHPEGLAEACSSGATDTKHSSWRVAHTRRTVDGAFTLKQADSSTASSRRRGAVVVKHA
jgi:hypothetical protein